MRVLTTGAGSGLGRHIHEKFGGTGWTRQLTPVDREGIKREGVDLIVHCAFNPRHPVDSKSLYDYMADNVSLTEELASIPHNEFILLSSVDVYPKGPGLCSESEEIEADAVRGIYGVTKLMSEAIVRKRCPNHLILRCVALLGKHSRKNALLRIIEDEPCTLTLSAQSRFNYVLHPDVSDFISFALDHQLKGIYNVASSGNVVLSQVADMLGKKVKFGDYRYDVGNIDNCKITSIFPAFKKTSEDVVTEFVGERAGWRGQCA